VYYINTDVHHVKIPNEGDILIRGYDFLHTPHMLPVHKQRACLLPLFAQISRQRTETKLTNNVMMFNNCRA
jgi:hypothetical protein